MTRFQIDRRITNLYAHLTLVYVAGFALIFVSFMMGIDIGQTEGVEHTMKEAFERGYATQCVGIEGYHWECPDGS